jgi:hypothetical protein
LEKIGSKTNFRRNQPVLTNQLIYLIRLSTHIFCQSIFTTFTTMKLKQLSLFLENKPGNVRKACRTLANSGINIETMALADTEQFGILRILVRDWERAKQEFEKNGVVVKVSEVVALAVDHRPGGLADILDVLDEAGLNIEYMYGFFQKTGNAVIVFRFDNPDAAIGKLQSRGIRVIGNKELFEKN